MAKVTRRIVPFLIVCYFAAYLDRVNVGFAALTMNKALGLSASAFGLGAGIFFLSYFVFEVPSNLLLERFGARKWIARIMFTWAILSGAMAFIHSESSFYIVRVLLGAAEAGFFPGIIFYLTLWFPAAYRARIIGYFMVAIPLSTVIGGPVSGLLLGMDGFAGFAGWQWLFIMEAVPALVLAFAVLVYLTDKPEQATWLTAEERTWLSTRLAAEQRLRETEKSFSVMEALGNTRVLLLSFVYFGAVAVNYGLGFFLPTIVHGFGLSYTATGFVTALPFAVGAVAMVYWGRRSDAKGERSEHVGLALLISGLGIAASTLIEDPTGKMIAISIAGFGIFAVLPVFWTLPTAFLSGPAAAGGIAIINSLGNLAGFAGPYVVGIIKDRTGSFTIGLLVIAGAAFLAMMVALSLQHDTKLEAPPAE
ncbi:MAG: MFS transporter [Rhodospirillales bacterium]|nr:MFS transporter [Rhodospirillales bacterium]